MNFDPLRQSARSLRKQPVFTTVVILSLALAISLNTTMYSVLDAVTHPRLDLRKPEQLYWIQFYGDFKYTVDNPHRDAALSSGVPVLSAITRGNERGVKALFVHGQHIAERQVVGVAANYFDVIGPRIIAGRTFLPADAESADSPLVLGQDMATELFPDGESPIGAVVDVDRVPHVVIGVVSSQSDFPHSKTGAWALSPYVTRGGGYTRLIRLRDGATAQDAERELNVIAARIAAVSGDNIRDVAFRFAKAADPGFQLARLHYALMFAVCAVLLVACANLANLQLARGIGRRRDLALRAALGATRGRIVRYLLTESSLLATCGLAAGLLFTYLGGRLLTASIPPSMGEFAVQTHLSWRVLIFALLATVICLLLIGVAPAVYVSRADPNTLLKSGAGTGSTTKNRQRYGILVAVEIALALALSSAAALSVRSAIAENRSAAGYDPSSLVTGYITNAISTESGNYSAVLQDIANRVTAVDGVSSATAYISRSVVNNAISIEDAGGVHEFEAPFYGVTVVASSYVRTFGYPIVRGHDFLDGQRDEGSVIVSEHTAHILWPNANPIGAQIKFGDLKSSLPYVRVVGVIGEVPGFEENPGLGVFMRNVRKLDPIYYLPGRVDTLMPGHAFGVEFVARARSHPERLVVTLRQTFALQGGLFAREIQPMDEFLGLRKVRQSANFISSLFSLFAVLGVALAAFGVYGVVAHSVAERRRELGVRIALGATARDILNAVLRESAVVALGGVAVGLFLTKYAKVYLSTLALEDDLYNAPLFAGVAAVLLLAAVVAAMIPAMRATRVDPTESLRNE